jgi:dihydroxyacetone kinase
MDGTSGAIYAIFLNALAYWLSVQDTSAPSPVTAEKWAKALKGALESLGKCTPARPGDRTLVDSLQSLVQMMIETGDFSRRWKQGRKDVIAQWE